jgi:hypothetical protein
LLKVIAKKFPPFRYCDESGFICRKNDRFAQIPFLFLGETSFLGKKEGKKKSSVYSMR